MSVIRNGNILEFKALTMSKGIFAQLPKYQPKGVMPEIRGWVNHEGEWFIAETSGRLVKIGRIDLWDTFACHHGKNYVETNQLFNEWRDKLPQIFLK